MCSLTLPSSPTVTSSSLPSTPTLALHPPLLIIFFSSSFAILLFSSSIPFLLIFPESSYSHFLLIFLSLPSPTHHHHHILLQFSCISSHVSPLPSSSFPSFSSSIFLLPLLLHLPLFLLLLLLLPVTGGEAVSDNKGEVLLAFCLMNHVGPRSCAATAVMLRPAGAAPETSSFL